MEIDSSPDELDNLKKEIFNLEIAKAGLKDQPNSVKVKKINKDLAQLKEKSREIELRWKNEKSIISIIRNNKKKIDELKAQAEIIQRRGDDLTEVAEIKYGRIPSLEKEIKKQEEILTKMQKAGQRILKEEIGEEDVAKVVAKWTGVPVTKMLESEVKKLSKIEDFLQEKIIGQNDAIKVIADAIRRSRAGLNEEKMPIGSFLFVGPTGVGKTELAKSLAEFIFNDQSALIRLDMSEYMEKHSVAKIIGSPPGYIGHDEGGQLTDRVRRKPYSVILFDEIEKAHHEVFNILLQILDDGRLTDSKGRTVNFKNTIVIMTSNLGNEVIQEYSIGFAETNDEKKAGELRQEEMKEKIDKILKENFKLEFLNRINEIVVFKSLSKEDLIKIVDLELEKMQDKLKNRDIKIKISKTVKNMLADKSYDKTFGARPLKRVIQNMILNELSKEIIEGHIKNGSKIEVNLGLNSEIMLAVK
jgi:ATP-dependent Clp protease ATP-binding subunit ClpB